MVTRAALYVRGAVLRDTLAPPVSVDLLGGCCEEEAVRFFFGVDRVGMQVKDCIVCTSVLLGPHCSTLYISNVATLLFCVGLRGLRLHVY